MKMIEAVGMLENEEIGDVIRAKVRMAVSRAIAGNMLSGHVSAEELEVDVDLADVLVDGGGI